MRTSALQAAQLLLFSTAVHALPEITIAKHRHADVNPARLRRRQNSDSGGTVETNTYDVLTWSTGGAYYANVTVGTPPQDQVVILDTGSSDLYFDSSTAETCKGTGPKSCRGGTFDHGASSSYKVVAESPAFNTSFGDGSTAVGPFAEDIIGIGDVSIAGVQFGVADEVTSTTGYAVGLMGLGYSVNEASKREYPNVPEVLASSGEIASRLYSIWLNDVDATSGTVLFGGIDTSKYTPPLVTLNMLPTEFQDPQTGETEDFVIQFMTTVTALNATVSSRSTEIFSGGQDSVSAYTDSNNLALPVLLDTGSSAWSVPQRYYEAIAAEFSYVDSNGLCDCSHRDSSDSIDVQFGEQITINVPARQFIVPIYDPATNEPQFDTRTNVQICTFMIVAAQDDNMNFQTLGDAVLRSMYVVFDLDNGQVSIAQASLDSKASPNIVPVSAGPNAVAKAASATDTSVPSNTYSIAPAVSGGETFTASTGSSTVGTATGTDAVPANARVSASGGSGSDSASGGAGAASSSAAAISGKRLGGGSDLAALGGIWVVFCMVFGGGVVLLA